MTPIYNEQFKKLLGEAKSDSNIIGFFLSGSRGKGYENKYSDYDTYIIVKNNVATKYKNRYALMTLKDIDLIVKSFLEFKNYASLGGPNTWDRYDFTNIKTLVDKNNQIQKLIDKKGYLSKDKLNQFIYGSLDAYINGVYRSVKCFRDKNQVGAKLEASASIPYLLDTVFALNNRPRPFYTYLERELKKYPLRKLPCAKEEFIKNILKIISTGDLTTQQDLLRAMEKMSRKAGFNKVFAGWKGKDQWAMNYRK